MNYTIYSLETGEILRSIECPPETVGIQTDPGEGILEGTGDWNTQYVSNGILTNYTLEQASSKAAKPYYPSKWSNTTFTWSDLRDISQIKNDRWLLIKQQRDSFIYSPLSTPYGVFDADINSQKNITDAIMLLQVSQSLGIPRTIDFTLSNNSTVTLTTEQMIEVGVILGNRTQEAHNIGRTLREQIEAATNAQQVESITWPTT